MVKVDEFSATFSKAVFLINALFNLIGSLLLLLTPITPFEYASSLNRTWSKPSFCSFGLALPRSK
ncbi:hypothetical protein IKD48_02040 [bacterium]|nr:hypothetical protein [bacterium]